MATSSDNPGAMDVTGAPAPTAAAVSGGATPELYDAQSANQPGFSPDDLVRQLNEWRTKVESNFVEIGASHRQIKEAVNTNKATTAGNKSAIEKVHGYAVEQGLKIDRVEGEARVNLQGVVDQGIASLRTTIEQFTVQLGIDRHALESVAVGAQAKFEEMDREKRAYCEQVHLDAKTMIETFNAEVGNGRAVDEALRVQIQSLYALTKAKFDQLDNFLDKIVKNAPQGGGGGAASGGQATAGGADPMQTRDPWTSFMAATQGMQQGTHGVAAGAAAAAAAGATGAMASGFDGAAGGSTRALNIMNRDWGNDNKRLDLVVKPEEYLTWHDRALGHLAKNRPDIRRLLLWAERQTGMIDEAAEKVGAGENGIFEVAGEVSYTLFEAIKYIISDNLLARARACGDGRGLELWRRLHSEWEGAAPQVVAAKARHFQDPSRCGTILQLWEALPTWEQLGVEVVSGGYPLPEWLQANALDKLIPEDLLKTVIGRPELAEYGAKLKWIKAQMEHAKGQLRVKEITAPTTKKRAGDDPMDTNHLRTEDGECDFFLSNLRDEYMKRAAAGDWEATETLGNTIFQFSKGKGKGKGKGAGGKGYNNKGGYGGAPWQPNAWQSSGKGFGKDGGKTGGKDGGGKGGKGGLQDAQFQGSCNHCGAFGHRKRECRKLDAEMAQRRAQRGPGGMNNLDDQGGSDGTSPEPGAEHPPGHEPQENISIGDDTWWMGSYHMTYDEEKYHVETPVSNRYAGLEADDIDYGPTPQESAKMGQAGRSPPAGPLDRSCTLQKKVRRRYSPLNLLDEDYQCKACDDSLNALGKPGDGARLVEAVVDSGAVDSVAPEGMFSAAVRPSAMSRAGKNYRGPAGEKIPNLGQQDIEFQSDEGHNCGLTMQVADVGQPLIAVTHLSEAGNDVTLNKKGGKIVNTKTGRTIQVQRKGRLYVLRMWIKDTDKAGVIPRPASVFPRQGRN